MGFSQRGSQVGTASNPVTVRFGGGGSMMVFEHTEEGGGEQKLAA